MIINSIIGGNGGETASIFVTGLSETDTVTAVNPSGDTILAVWNGTAWVFAELKEYGTYTVTATDGTNTVTQDVLVDMATQYDISLSIEGKLWLYNLGDECEDVTGGWLGTSYSTNGAVTKLTNSIKLHSYRASIYTANTLNLGLYNKIYVHCNYIEGRTDASKWNSLIVKVGTTSVNYGDPFNSNQIKEFGDNDSGDSLYNRTLTDYTLTLDISDITTSAQIGVRFDGPDAGNTYCTIDKIWLE